MLLLAATVRPPTSSPSPAPSCLLRLLTRSLCQVGAMVYLYFVCLQCDSPPVPFVPSASSAARAAQGRARQLCSDDFVMGTCKAVSLAIPPGAKTILTLLCHIPVVSHVAHVGGCVDKHWLKSSMYTPVTALQARLCSAQRKIQFN